MRSLLMVSVVAERLVGSRRCSREQRGKMKKGRDSDRVTAGYFKEKRKNSENPGGRTFAASNKS